MGEHVKFLVYNIFWSQFFVETIDFDCIVSATLLDNAYKCIFLKVDFQV
jgi:hypothetical protein